MTHPLASKLFSEISDAELQLLNRSERLKDIKLPEIWTSEKLLSAEFPPIRWIIPGIIPQGFTLLVGASKIGKSWLALGMGIALADGGRVLGSIQVEPTPVLMLCLEDTPRRLQSRLSILNAKPSVNLKIVTRWKRLPDCLSYLEKYYLENPDVRAVFIDTLGMVRSTGDQNYLSDYDEISQLKKFSDDLGLSIIALHHTRKMADPDYLNTVTGSVGIVGAADTIVILNRTRGKADAVLQVTGRDVDEQELALKFDADIGSWSIIGDAAEVQKTRERQEVYDIVKDLGEAGPKEIAEVLERKDTGAIRKILSRMVEDGEIERASYGKYRVKACHTGNTVTATRYLHTVKDVSNLNSVTESVTLPFVETQQGYEL